MARLEVVKKSDLPVEATTLELKSPSVHYTSYSDVPGLEVNQLDVLAQLNANILHLEDLHGRLRFMMVEIQSLVKKR